MKKIVLFFLFIIILLDTKAQVLSSVSYPRTPAGQSIETMYVDSVSNILYIGGDFTSLELPPTYSTTAIRKRIAAIDLKTGNLLPWTQSIDNGIIYSIEKSGDTIYAGGDFTSVNSQSYRDLVAFDEQTSNNNFPIYYPFSHTDIIKCLLVNNNSIFVGGLIDTFNLVPATHLLELNKASGNTINTFPNTISLYPDYFINVSKMQLKNNNLYFIAETIDLGSFTVFDKSIFNLNLSVSSSASYLNKALLSFPGLTIPKIDDFTIINNEVYSIGNFDQLEYGNGNIINRNKTACYNLTTNLFSTWSPSVSSNGFLSTLSSSHGIKSSHIIPFNNWLFFSEEYSTIIDTNSYASGSGSNYTYITGAPALNSLTPTSGSFFFDMKTSNGNLIVLNREIYSGIRNNIYSYCLQSSTPASPISITNANIFCRLSSYSFYVPNAIQYSSINWSYSGTGATIINNGNDTISMQFALNATPGNLTLYGTNICGQNSTSVSIPITFHPIPNVSAGNDTTLNCSNHLQIILTGTSTVSNNTLLWYSPSYTSFTNNSTVDSSGTYTLQVTDNSTGCINFDTLQITYDTIAPVLNVAPSYSIYSCSPKNIIVNATSSNPTDTIIWQIGSSIHSNPDTLLAGNTYYAIATGLNGCSDTALVNVYDSTSSPVLNIPAVPVISGVYILDTITCSKDSISFNFTSPSTNTIIYIIQNSTLDTIPNNSYIDTAGVYSVYLVDTTNGCHTGPILFSILNNFTPPALGLLGNNPVLNCSSSSTILNADSGTPNVSLTWTGPGNFSSPDPATVNQIGTYSITATNPANGCTKIDSITVIYQNTLTLNSTNDSLICKGDSVTLASLPIGGTPNFNYLWSNVSGNITSTIVSPNDTTSYFITITDAAGCIGKDTITVNIPTSITDSTASFAPCDQQNPNGQIQIFASGGIPPYLFSMNNSAFQSNSVFDSLNFGNYNLTIKDSLGCTHSYIHTISTQSLSPQADFIISTTMMEADTFVVVDISNPRPDSVFWTFPSSITIINNNMFAPVIISSDTGYVQVTMEAHFGTCVSNLTKNVKFIKPDTTAASPNGNGIESVTIFPNPNTGQFSVEVKLYKKQTFAIYVYNAQGVEQVRATFSELNYGLSAFNLPTPTPGTYVVKVVAEFDSKSKIFTVTQ